MSGSSPHPSPADDRRSLLRDALRAVDEMSAKVRALERARTEPIAIVGLGCRFPGGADDPAGFWTLLEHGVDAITEIPASRWSAAAGARLAAAHAGVTRPFGGFLRSVDTFDPAFFGISIREARSMDPQQRLLLEVVWEALEHAGQPADKLRGSITGVFVGIGGSDYADLVRRADPNGIDMHTATGNALNAAAGRISYVFGLQGPSVAIDTACSSSLTAVHLACQSLRLGESDLALAGGVNVMLAPEPFLAFARWGMMAPDGRCKSFDAGANGFVRSEGCGIVVLKRLSDVVPGRDRVLALILGSGVNQDGPSGGLTIPNGLAQQAVIRRALSAAGANPGDVDYVEAHGTGTAIGDSIELEALDAVFGEARDAGRPLVVGSVKANIGHLETAAGIAGLIKVVLSLEHERIPRQLHFQRLNPAFTVDATRIAIPSRALPWPRGERRRVAAVSSFGISGTNAHVIVTDPPAEPVAAGSIERPLQVLTLSARTPEALQALAARYGQCMEQTPPPSIRDASFSANTGRVHFGHRAAVVGSSGDEMRRALAALAAGRPDRALTVGQLSGEHRPRIAFLFSGEGVHAGMGRSLAESQPTFRKALEQCDALFRPGLGESLLNVLAGNDPQASAKLDQAQYGQAALFAVQYALAELWRSWGVLPGAVFGHGAGECAAAWMAGALRLEEATALVATRARLTRGLSAPRAMAEVFADDETVAAVLGRDGDVLVAAVNGPANTVISGTARATETAMARLAKAGIKVVPRRCSPAFDAPLPESSLDGLALAASATRPSGAGPTFIAGATGQPIAPADAMDGTYWRRQAKEPVRFAAAMKTLRAQRYDVFIEIGPAALLLGLGRACIDEDRATAWLPSLDEGRDDWAALAGSLAQLYVHGASIDWNGFDRDYSRRRVVLPTYPFQRQRHWMEVAPAGDAAVPAPQPATPVAPRPAAPELQRVDGLRPAETGLQKQLVAIWEEVLSVRPIGVQDNFFELGGTSLLAIELFTQIERHLGVKLPLATLFQTPTIEGLALLIHEGRRPLSAGRALVAIQPLGQRPPLFAMPGIYGNVLYFNRLARLLGSDQPFYGLQCYGFDGSRPPLSRMEDVAAEFLREVREIQPHGPYYLFGSCWGGIAAYEMAQQLRAAGEEVALLTLQEAWPPFKVLRPPVKPEVRGLSLLLFAAARVQLYLTTLRSLRGQERREYLRDRLRTFKRLLRQRSLSPTTQDELHASMVYRANLAAYLNYEPRAYPGPAVVFRGEDRPLPPGFDPRGAWANLLTSEFEFYTVPGKDARVMLLEPDVAIFVKQFKACLERAQTSRILADHDAVR